MNISAAATVKADYLFGWDLLYKTIEASIKRKADICIALAHFLLVRHYDFRCCGLGDQQSVQPDEACSELLPSGWNHSAEKYVLRYFISATRQLYVLMGQTCGNHLIINLMDAGTLQTSNVLVNPEELVQDASVPLAQLLPTITQILAVYREQLIHPVFQGAAVDIGMQTDNLVQSSSSIQDIDGFLDENHNWYPHYIDRSASLYLVTSRATLLSQGSRFTIYGRPEPVSEPVSRIHSQLERPIPPNNGSNSNNRHPRLPGYDSNFYW